LLKSEALDVLALRPGAAPSEIKEAYRDLVKVWHPDRFGNDVRLRKKAELQLKLINEAYRTLQSNAGSAPGNAAHASPGDKSSPGGAYWRRYTAAATTRHDHGWSRPNKSAVGWLYRGLGLSLILLVAYLIIERTATQHGEASRASESQQSPGVPVQQAAEGLRGGRLVHSADSNALRSRGVTHAKDSRLQQFQIRSLSAAETDRLQILCSTQRQAWGQAAYQSCLKAQLDVMTNPTGKPDFSGLRPAERESIESVCSAARRLRGTDSYNRCATQQLASLAAEPARPDLSKLNDADRNAIESTCTNVKVREGPAAYNRCLDRLINTLAQAR
jgi:curved DNA-binding protein CbpA